MRRYFVAIGLVACALAAVMTWSAAPASAKQGGATFLIPPSEGYGIAECLHSGTDCGRVVADGWCEANGFAAASAFGPIGADEITGSVDVAPAREATLAITCEE